MLQDLRYSVRTLLKQPGLTSIIVLTLALGIGANTAIFSIVNAVLLRALPYPESERLVKVNRVDLKGTKTWRVTSPMNFLDWKSQNRTFESLGSYLETTAFNLSDGSEPERITGSLVSDSLFPTLGVSPMLGRNFTPEEDRNGAPNVVVLSHSFWLRRFGGPGHSWPDPHSRWPAAFGGRCNAVGF